MWLVSIVYIIALATSVFCIGELPAAAASVARELFASTLGFSVLVALFGRREWFGRAERPNARRFK